MAALVDARELRATAAAAVEAAARVAAHRRALGDRPRLDREAAAEAMEADAATVWAQAGEEHGDAAGVGDEQPPTSPLQRPARCRLGPHLSLIHI